MSTTFPPVNQDGNPFHAGLPDYVTLSPAIYNASLPPKVLALMQMPNDTSANKAARFAVASALHAAGYAIDLVLVMWEEDAPVTQYLRQTAGLRWVNDAFGPTGGGSGEPPEGVLTLPVSVDANDYPPAIPPTPTPLPSTNMVGIQLSGNIFGTGPGVIVSPPSALNVIPNHPYVQNGVTYIATVEEIGPGMISVYFTKQ